MNEPDDDLPNQEQHDYTYHFFFAHGLYDQLISLRKFVESVDTFLQDELERRSSIEQESGPKDPLYTAQMEYGDIYPDILWSSTFTHTFFLAESALNEICGNLANTHNYRVLLNDMSGSGIKRAKLYLDKVCKLDVASFFHHWDILADLQLIRNTFAHAEGFFKLNNPTLKMMPQKFKGLSVHLSHDGRMEGFKLTKQFCLEVIEIIYDFFQKVQESMFKGQGESH